MSMQHRSAEVWTYRLQEAARTSRLARASVLRYVRLGLVVPSAYSFILREERDASLPEVAILDIEQIDLDGRAHQGGGPPACPAAIARGRLPGHHLHLDARGLG